MDRYNLLLRWKQKFEDVICKQEISRVRITERGLKTLRHAKVASDEFALESFIILI